jgi:hypothetical protein
MNQVVNATVQQLVDAFSAAQSSPQALAPGSIPNQLLKAITQATGLVWYDLQPYAKLLFPVITPLRNEIPRTQGNGGTSTHWKSITAININNVSIGLGEGQRGGTVTTQEVDVLATYKTIGLDDSVTFQADWAAKNFDDVKRLAVDNLLKALMIGEEKMLVGANSSLQLGTTPTPTIADITTGGTLLANTAYSVIGVALAFDGFTNGSVAGGIQAAITRTNTDGSSITYGGGSAQKSAAAAVTTANDASNTHCVSGTIAAVRGAVGYAWFWGSAGNEVLGAITSINSIKITANATGTQTAASLPSSDNSTNAYLADGLITQIETAGSNSYYGVMPTGTPGTGSTLTSDGAGGIVEIDTALKAFWDNFKLSPQVILVNAQELKNISTKTIAAGGTPLFRFVIDAGNVNNPAQLSATAGQVVGNYLNKYTMSGGALVQVLLHPNVPAGTMIFYSRMLPYPLSNVANLLEVRYRQDYRQIEWPIVKPQYEYSILADEVLVNYFPPAFGVLTNIANG